MKKLVVAGLMLACAFSATNVGAQEKEGEKEEGFIFTTVKENPITSIKNQNRAGTCWCYSTMAFLESELLRMGSGSCRYGCPYSWRCFVLAGWVFL